MSDDRADWLGLSTATVSDALDRLGIAGQIHGLAPLRHDFRLVGRAFTVRYVPVGTARGTVGDYIDDLAPGTVVALDNRGRTDATVWGDILTSVAHRRGLAGTVIDGVCRDIDRSFALSYPIYSRGRWMRTGKDRVQAEGFGEPVTLGTVCVASGDLLLGDGDGILAVPAMHTNAVLELARMIEAAEDRIRALVEGGMRLDEARRASGYFELQRKL